MKDYLFVFLRLAKNKPAAAIMMRHPAIVKIVVPIPPVCGRECNFVSETFTVAFGLFPFVITAFSFTSTTEYPAGAFSSTILYVPSLRPVTLTVPFVATTFVTLFAVSSAVANLYSPSFTNTN